MKKKILSDKDFDKRLEAGEDLSDYFIKGSASKNVLVSFRLEMLKFIDSEALALGVPRTALIKMWIADRIKEEKKFQSLSNN
jgi:hypothetical protein